MTFKNKGRKRIAIFLVLLLILQVAPLPEGAFSNFFDFSKSAKAATSGTINGISWKLTTETKATDSPLEAGQTAYKLTLTGSGAIPDFYWESYVTNAATGETDSRTTAPWKEYAKNIQTVSVGSGITQIGDYSFYNSTALKTATMANSVTSIGSSVFSNCSALKTCTLSTALKSISNNAFYYCTEMVNCSLPNSLTSIYSAAFYSCSSLTSINLGSNLTYIAESAFAQCSSLTSVTYPGIELSQSCFTGCKNLKTVTMTEGTKTIGNNAFTGCINLNTITFPKSSLTKIGESAFSSTAFTTITIPASVTTIPANPFTSNKLTEIKVASGNTHFTIKNNLLIELKNGELYKALSYPYGATTSVTVPSPVQEIGGYCFYGLSLISCALPASLVTIGTYAFHSNNKITRMDIPGNVTTIGAYSFVNCSLLSNVSFGGDITSIGINAFSNCSKLASLDLPDKIKTIGSSAFTNCTSLKEITLPNSLETLGDSVFQGCTSVESVSMGQNINTINGSVFNNCSKISTLTISPKNTSMIVVDNVLYNTEKTTVIFYAPSKPDEKFMIPDTVSTIGRYAFTYGVNLSELRIPASVTKIEQTGIYRNNKLGKILFYGDAPEVTVANTNSTVTNGVRTYKTVNGSINNNKSSVSSSSYNNSGMIIFHTASASGFNGKGWMISGTTDTATTKYVWDEKFTISLWDPSKTDIADGSFDSGITWHYRDDIGEISFAGKGKTDSYTEGDLPTWSNDESVDHMKDIRIVDTTACSAIELGDYSFYGATSLIRLNAAEELTTIGSHAFANCTALLYPYIQSVRNINDSAFEGDCSFKEEVDLRGAIVLGNKAFKDCTSTIRFMIGDSMTTMGNECFAGCNMLKNIILSDALTTIGDGCFKDCTVLRTLNIPATVTSIGDSCFEGCNEFKKIYFYGDYPSVWADNSLDNCHEDLTIYYRAGNTSWENNITNNQWNSIPVIALGKFYTENKDYYSFANQASSFGYGSTYAIPRQRYVTATQSIIRGTYYYNASGVWSGNCFGMSSSSEEFYEGEQFNIKDYSSTANSLYDIQAPRNSTSALTKLIEVYQVSQFAEPVADEIGNNMMDYRELINKVEEFERSGGLRTDSTADPVVLCIFNHLSGHAIVPVSVRVNSNKEYEFQVYDCNYPNSFRTLRIDKTLSKINYDGYTYGSFTTYNTIKSALEYADFTGKTYKKAEAESTKIAVTVDRDDISIENGGGKDVSEIKGAYKQEIISGGAPNENKTSYVLPTNEYIIKNTTKNDTKDTIQYDVATEDFYAEVISNDPQSTILVKSVSGKGYDHFTLESSDEDASFNMVVMNDEGIKHDLEVTGSSVEVDITEDNRIDLSNSQDIEDVKVDGESIDLQSQIPFDGTPIDLSDPTPIPPETTPAPNKVTYTVNYWTQDIDGDAASKDELNYTLKTSKEKLAYENSTIIPETIDIPGFATPNAVTAEVPSDDSLVINYYYTRKTYPQTVQARYENADGSFSDYQTIYVENRSYEDNFSYSMPASDLYQAVSVDAYKVKGENLEKTTKITVNRVKHNVSLATSEGVTEVSGAGSYRVGETFTIDATLADKYEWVKWSDGNIIKNRSLIMGFDDIDLVASAKEVPTPPNKISTTYTVRHWQQNLDGEEAMHDSENYTLVNTKVFSAKSLDEVSPATNRYDGFDSPDKQTITVLASGLSVVNYYYTRKTFKQSLLVRYEQEDGGYSDYELKNEATIPYGATYKYTEEASDTHEGIELSPYVVEANTVNRITVNLLSHGSTEEKDDTPSFDQMIYARYENPDGSFTDFENVFNATVKQGETFSYVIPATEIFTETKLDAYEVTSENNIRLDVKRRTVKLTLTKGTGIDSVEGSGVYRVGQSVTISAKVNTDYNWSKWSDGNPTISRTYTLANKDVTLIASATKKTIPVTLAKQEITKGYTTTINYIKFKVINVNNTPSVSVCGYTSNKDKLDIPDSIKIEGKEYQVTEIDQRAFYKNKKLRFITIGSKITSIGSKAFYKCSKLKYILVKSKNIKSVGTKAFKGTANKINVKSPKKSWNKYYKLFIKKGNLSKKATFIIDPVKIKYKGKSY